MVDQINNDDADTGSENDTPDIQAQIDAAVKKATEGLSAKNAELLGEVKKERTARREVEAKLDGVDLEAVKKFISGAEQAELEQKKKDGKWDEILSARDEAHAAKLSAIESSLTERATRAEEFAKGVLIDGQLAQALAQANIAPHYAKAATALVKGQIQVRSDDDSYLVPFVDVDGSEMSVTDFVRVWAESEEGKYFVQAPTNGGGGMNGKPGQGGSKGVNPWKRETRNLTEQGRIVKTDPQLAARLKKEAGVA